MNPSLDFLSCIVDEISLEGLDGITLETLWQRLRDRPHFPIAVDDDSKNYFWKNVAKLKDIEIYQLPKPREFAPTFDRFANVDPELDAVCDPPFKIQDPHYPIVPIKDGEIRGSCAMYSTRICITSQIRCSNEVLILSLCQVVERYGDSLVLVSSPKARLLALIGSETNPLIDLSLEEYCLLERIGRSRYLGEVTQGENGLLSLKATFCKHLHYYRKKLTKKLLITKQDYSTKTRKGATSTGSLFHLTRFYVLRKTKMACLLKSVCDILKDKPQNRAAYTEIRDQLGSKRSSFKNLCTKHFQKWLITTTVTCRELYPNGSKKEWYTAKGHDKVVKVLQLVKHCDEEDSDDETSEGDLTIPLNVHFDYSKIVYGVPLLHQMYCLIKQAVPEGISSADLGREMTLPKLDIRSIVRVLDRKGHISSVPRSRGRQIVHMYISNDYINKSETYSNHKEQEQRLVKEDISNNISMKRKFDYEEGTDGVPLAKAIKLEEADENIHLKYHEIQLENTKSDNILSAEFQNIKYKVNEITYKSNLLTNYCGYENAPEILDVSPQHSSLKQFTFRKLKRCNIILDFLKKDPITTASDLQKNIHQMEKKEGYNFTLDKRSVTRLIDHLIRNDKIKKIVIELECEDKQTKIEFICEKSIQKSDPRLLLAIEQAKIKYFCDLKYNNVNGLVEETKYLTSKFESTKCASIANNFNVSKQEICKTKLSHGYPSMSPKFVRARALHIFLYYLVYQNKNRVVTSGDKVIYHNSMSWKRFVPPIPDYGHRGWVLISDIYARMPLSLFIQFVNYKKVILSLKDCLKNEETANYLIQFLPQNVRNDLLKNLKYIVSIGSAIHVLCYMGLVSIGPEIGKQKDQAFLYVHKKATLKDTTTSPPGYIHIDKDRDYFSKAYEFEMENCLEDYWQELEYISFHTPLGKYSTAIGKTLKVVDPAIKSELMSCTKNIHFDRVCDEGIIPGDGLGAAGYDSSLFLHTRRNWKAYTAGINKYFGNSLKTKGESKFSECLMQHLLKSSSMAKPSTRGTLQRLTKHSSHLQEERKLKPERHDQVKELKNVAKTKPLLRMKTQKKSKFSEGKLCNSGGKKSKNQNTKNFKNKNKKQLNIKQCNQVKGVSKTANSCRSTIEHKNKRGVKLITIKSRLLKRVPFYDEIDKLAMGKLDKQRCHWSPQEDSFLLLCKVASCFLQPTTYSRTIVVHYSIVRDLLHENVPGVSADKTSRACQRRMKYIMRHPTTVNNVKLFLGEVLRDADMVKEFDKPKPPRTEVESWKKIFTKLINVMREKFVLPGIDRCTNLNIPQTMQEFNDNFEIMTDNDIFRTKKVYNDPDDIEDIPKGTLTFLILSAMAVKNEDQWTPILNKMYQAYPENVLQSAVAHLRKESVISVKSKAHRSDIRHLRQSTSPYKFSFKYHNAKIAKFPRQNFEEAKVFLNSLNSLDLKSNIELKGDVSVGFTASVLSLLATERLHINIQVPDQILLFDSTLSKKARTNIVDRMASTLSDMESVELLQYLSNDNNFLLDENSSTQTHSNALPESSSVKAPQSSNLSITDIDIQSSEVQRPSKASRLALYLLRQELSQHAFEKEHHSQDYIVLNACRVFCRLEPSTPSVLPMNPYDIYEEPLDWKSGHTNQCKELKKDSIGKISNILTGYIPSDCLVMHSNYYSEIQVLYDRYQLQTVTDAKLIFSNLFRAGQKGLSETELWRNFTKLSGELSLFEHLHIFREAFLILRVGVTGFTYVCTCFANSWVLQIPKNLINKVHSFERIQGEKQTKKDISFVKNKYHPPIPHTGIPSSKCTSPTQFENEHFNMQPIYYQGLRNSSQHTQNYYIPRTWRNPDGSLNKPVLFDLLFTLLSYLISNPGASTSKICDNFSLIIPAVQILELLEILENSYCIYKYYCKPVGKVTLFSTPPKTFITLNPEPGYIDHIEVFPDAVCKIVELMDVRL